MKLEIARQIMSEQYEYILSLEESLYTDKKLNLLTNNGDEINNSLIIDDYQIKEFGDKFDNSKIHVTEEDQNGGEGEGDDYNIIFKIDHPEHGVGYIKYYGSYDAWNGVDWEGCVMVEPLEKTVRIWV